MANVTIIVRPNRDQGVEGETLHFDNCEVVKEDGVLQVWEEGERGKMIAEFDSFNVSSWWPS